MADYLSIHAAKAWNLQQAVGVMGSLSSGQQLQRDAYECPVQKTLLKRIEFKAPKAE